MCRSSCWWRRAGVGDAAQQTRLTQRSLSSVCRRLNPSNCRIVLTNFTNAEPSVCQWRCRCCSLTTGSRQNWRMRLRRCVQRGCVRRCHCTTTTCSQWTSSGWRWRAACRIQIERGIGARRHTASAHRRSSTVHTTNRLTCRRRWQTWRRCLLWPTAARLRWQCRRQSVVAFRWRSSTSCLSLCNQSVNK